MKRLRLDTTALAIIYLILPIAIFFLTWLRGYMGIPASLLLCAAAYYFVQAQQCGCGTDPTKLSWTREGLFASTILFAFLLLTGQGTFIGSAGFDTPWRLAMYHDLIYQSWPVVYEYSHGALIYYLAFWLVPAGIASLLGLGETGQNLMLVLWSYIGLRLFVALLWDYLKLNKKQIIPITLFFLFWGGMNTVGMLIMDALGVFSFQIDTEWGFSSWWFTSVSVDGYRMAYMIRTVFDSLANTYNQFIAAILVTLLFLKHHNVKHMAFLGLLLVPYSPLGFIGLFFLMVAEAVRQGYDAVKAHAIPVFLKAVFSKENILATCTIFPVFLLYFTANGIVDNTVTAGSTGVADPTYGILSAPLYAYGVARMFILMLYYMLFFWIFMYASYKQYESRLLFWSVFLSLSLIPLFKVGNSADFCFNASVPAFFIVMIMLMKESLQLSLQPKINKHSVVIVVVVVIAMLTTVLQLASVYKKCVRYETVIVKTDFAGVGGTFSDKTEDEIKNGYKNFTNTDFTEKPFYQYLAKPRT